MSKGINEYKNGYDFYKDSETDQIWQVDNHDQEGPYLFNFWTDYPDKLTPEQIKNCGGIAHSGKKSLILINQISKYRYQYLNVICNFLCISFYIHIIFLECVLKKILKEK